MTYLYRLYHVMDLSMSLQPIKQTEQFWHTVFCLNFNPKYEY